MDTRAQAAGPASAALQPDLWLGERLNAAAFTLPAGADPTLRPSIRPAFVQTKTDVRDAERLSAVVRAGFSLVETAVTLEKPLRAPAQAVGAVRFAEPGDRDAVRDIAGSAFVQSRFHTDPLIPRSVANRIKADWAGNFFSGARGTHMVVAQNGPATAGFLLLIHRGDELIIDLVGVAPGSQGRGLGRQMLDFAAARIAGPARYVVGTQLHNVQSLAYYTGYGFRVARANHSLHLHLG